METETIKTKNDYLQSLRRFEEIFQAPACEHRNGNATQIGLVVGAYDGILVAAFLTTRAHFAYP